MLYNKKFSIEKITIGILLALGIIIPLVQFLYNRSLWQDEAMLALNIIRRGYSELLKPLDYSQVAPILFLEIEKFFSTLIPDSEYGLRLLSLLSFLVALFFFYKTVKTIFDNRPTAIFALSIFIFNVSLIYYSSEVKQYMSDVMVYTAIVYFILKDYKREQTKYYILGIAGVLAVFLSNVAPIILSVAGLYLIYEQFCMKRQKNNITGLIILFTTWLSVFAIYYYFFIFNHPAREYMLGFWSEQGAFLPFDSLRDFVYFLCIRVKVVLHIFSFQIILKIIVFLLFTTGLFCAIRKKKIGLVILTCFPGIIHLFLSGLHLYPFKDRLILYIMPGLMLVCAAGFNDFIRLLSPSLKSVCLKLFCFTPVIFLFSFNTFPIKNYSDPILNLEIKNIQMHVRLKQILSDPSLILKIKNTLKYLKENINDEDELKKAIKYLKENVKDDETIYVNWFLQPTFQYYQDIGLIDFKIPIYMGKDKQTPVTNLHLLKEEQLKEMEKIHGKCWLLFTPYYWHDEEYIPNRLDSIGYQRIKEYKTSCIKIYLYDLK